MLDDVYEEGVPNDNPTVTNGLMNAHAKNLIEQSKGRVNEWRKKQHHLEIRIFNRLAGFGFDREVIEACIIAVRDIYQPAIDKETALQELLKAYYVIERE